MSDFDPSVDRRLARLEAELAAARRSLSEIYSQRFPRTLAAVPESDGIEFTNYSGETIPPYAVMRMEISGYGYTLNALKPNGTFNWLHLVNGESPVPTTATAIGYWCTKKRLVRSQSLSIAPHGAMIGPVPGQWHLGPSRYGFMRVGKANGDDTHPAVECEQLFRYTITCRAAGSLAKWPSGDGDTVDLYSGIRTDLGQTLKVKSLWAAAYGKWLIVERIGDQNTVVAVEC
jgi:hypothetical protein